MWHLHHLVIFFAVAEEALAVVIVFITDVPATAQFDGH
jgi:hypothetical protein